MTDSEREALSEFVKLMQNDRQNKPSWLPAVMSAGNIAAIIWAAAMITGEVKTLRRDVTLQGQVIERLQVSYLDHIQYAARAVENIDGRMQSIEERLKMTIRRIPEAK